MAIITKALRREQAELLMQMMQDVKQTGTTNRQFCQEKNENGTQVEIVITYDPKFAEEHPELIHQLQDNQKVSNKYHSYCMIADNEQDALQYTAIFLNQPRNQAAFDKVDLRADSYLGSDYVAICVFDVPDDVLARWDATALAKINPANETYVDTNRETVTCPEIVISDASLRESLTSGYLVRFGSCQQVFESAGLTRNDYDPDHILFNQTYATDITIGIEPRKKTTESTISSASSNDTDCPYKDPRMQKIYYQIINATDLPKETRQELMRSLKLAGVHTGQSRQEYLDAVEETVEMFTAGEYTL